MVIPYISNRTLPRYFQYLVEGYTFKPTRTEFVANDQAKPVYQNYMDYKVIDSFSLYQPTEYLIYHASDVYLMPNDLDDMIAELICNEKAFTIGLYPITDYLPTNMNETPVLPGRIGIWKADLFQKYLDEFKKLDKKSSLGLMVDEIYRMGELAARDGYECLISKTARPQRMWHKEFKVASLT